MTGFKPITPAERAMFEDYLGRASYESSEYTFANFFIWRHWDRSSWKLINDNLCVRAEPAGQAPYFFPPLGRNRIVETIEQCLAVMKADGQPPLVAHVTPTMLDRHPEFTRRYLVEEDRDNFDYIYRLETLCRLKGRKYSAQRNHLKNFIELYRPSNHAITPADFPDCHRLLDQWALAKTNPLRSRAENAYLLGSVGAAREIINNWSGLRLTGLIVLAGGEPAALSFGEKIGPETAVTYTEIARADLKGASQYVNHQFGCRFEGLKYLNREQDLGLPGLRRAKSAYYPDHFIKKFTLRPK